MGQSQDGGQPVPGRLGFGIDQRACSEDRSRELNKWICSKRSISWSRSKKLPRKHHDGIAWTTFELFPIPRYIGLHAQWLMVSI